MQYLRDLGCEAVVAELPFFDRGIDIYAVKRGPRASAYAVELKIRDWQKALRQAAIYQLCCDYSYVALPPNAACRVDIELFKQCGIGLLSVERDESVTVILKAKKSIEQRAYYIRKFKRLVLKDASNGTK
jgi:hypothetical protein